MVTRDVDFVVVADGVERTIIELQTSESTRRQSKRLKDLADIARLVEAQSDLWASLPDELKNHVQRPV